MLLSHVSICAMVLVASALVQAGDAAAPKIEFKDHDEQSALVVKAKCKLAEIGPTLGKCFQKVGAYMKEKGIKFEPPLFALYLKVDNGECELEGGAVVPKGTEGKDDVLAITLPKGKVAFSTHLGPYEGLSDYWMALMKSLADQKKEPAGPGWEVYMNDPGSVKPEEIRTDIYIPVKE